MNKEKDTKDIVQSYLITTARYHFTLTEKRIMYKIIESGQDLIEGKKLRGRITINETLLKDKEVSMSYADVLDNDRHTSVIKTALMDLMSKKVVWETELGGSACTLIERPEWDNQRGMFSFRVPAPIWSAMMLQFEKGYRKYQLATAMSFGSVYSMRIYEIVSGQQYPLTYTIQNLKEMLGIGNKYPRIFDFKKRVLNVAKTELDEIADYGFDYIIKGTKNATITLLPYPLHRGSHAELNRVKRDMSVSWFLPTEITSYLKQKGFTQKEIKAHLELFSEAYKELDLMLVLAELTAKARDKANPKGYVINAIRGKLKDKLKDQNALEQSLNID